MGEYSVYPEFIWDNWHVTRTAETFGIQRNQAWQITFQFRMTITQLNVEGNSHISSINDSNQIQRFPTTLWLNTSHKDDQQKVPGTASNPIQPADSLSHTKPIEMDLLSFNALLSQNPNSEKKRKSPLCVCVCVMRGAFGSHNTKIHIIINYLGVSQYIPEH